MWPFQHSIEECTLSSSYLTVWVWLMLKRKEFTLEVSTSPIENIKALRILAESNEWSLTTHEGSRLVDRFAIIIPMAQSANSWFRGDGWTSQRIGITFLG